MRKFYLVNDKLEYYYFDEKDQALVTDVSGLGFEKDLNFSDTITSVKLNEKNPIGKLN